MSGQASWEAAEPGWAVSDGEGQRIGLVEDVSGEGLHYRAPDGDVRFIAAGEVAAVEAGCVTLLGRPSAGGGDPA